VSNTFRKQYRELSAAEKAHVELIKDTAERLEELIKRIPTAHLAHGPTWEAACIARSTALLNLEQAVS
jgi:hypothetical protein